MNFTKNTIEKLELINTMIIEYSKMPVEILNKRKLKDAFLFAKSQNNNLVYEFEKYGNIEDLTLYGHFLDEYTNELKMFHVKKVYSIFECFAFRLCKDNFLTYQKSKLFLDKIKNL